jgi:hypothetical protein
MKLFPHQKQLLEFLEMKQHYIEHSFTIGEKVVMRPRNHPAHKNHYPASLLGLENKVLTVKDPGYWVFLEDVGNVRSERLEPYIHDFKPGDKVVLRPKDHPGHNGSWPGRSFEELLGRVLTVSAINPHGCISLAEENGLHRWHNFSRFSLAEKVEEKVEKPFTVGGMVMNLQNGDGPYPWKAHYRPENHRHATQDEIVVIHDFIAGDKIVLRPQGHPGHGDDWDEEMLKPLFNKVLTVKSVDLPDRCLYIDDYIEYGLYISRFEPAPVVKKAKFPAQSSIQSLLGGATGFPDSKVTMDFQLRENASRRTKQRWKVHQAGNCNTAKCRFCKKAAHIQIHDVAFDTAFLDNLWSPTNNEQAKGHLGRKRTLWCDNCHADTQHACCDQSNPNSYQCDGCANQRYWKRSVDKPGEPGIINQQTQNPCGEVAVSKSAPEYMREALQEQQEATVSESEKLDEIEILPSAYGVLEEAVADQYGRAAKQVARTKAEVEVYQEALIPGMMVYHRFNHHPAILLMETQPGFWTIELKDGSTENEVPEAILTPICPNIFLRAWMLLKLTLSNIFYKDVEITNSPLGNYTVRRFRGKLFATMILTVLLAAAWPFIYSAIFPR